MMPSLQLFRRARWVLWLGLVVPHAAGAAAPAPAPCVRTISADVVALDQPLTLNRLGASLPGGMIFALADDVVACDPTDASGTLTAGKVMLRPGKRPRPLVLRMNVGDCLRIHFTNLLSPSMGQGALTRYAGLHINGLDLVPSAAGAPGIAGDGSWVGKNGGAAGSLVPPGGGTTYTYFAKAEGTFLIASADNSGADNLRRNQGQPGQGLFGALNVQPEWAEWYRSQVTNEDLLEATLRMEEGFSTAVRSLPLNAAQAVGGQGPGALASKPVNNRLLRLLPSRATPPQAGPTEAARVAAIKSHVGERTLEPFTLLSVIPDKHAELITDVLRDPQGRLYSRNGHPLIDYNSVYRAGKRRVGVPVLKMLQTVKGNALFTTNLTAEEVERAQIGLVSANSYVTAELTRQFATLGGTKPAGPGIDLSDDVRVTDAEGTAAWLLTDPRRGLYLVERVSGPAPGFAVSDASLKLVHSDLTAVITGPRAQRFGFGQESPTFFNNPALPDRRQPYREFTIIYHFVPTAVQAFEPFNAPSTAGAFAAGQDQFAINYGTAAIGAEVIANRIGVGPMGNADAVDLKFEEFFLSSWAVGDPSMVVDVPAGAQAKAGVRRAPGKPLFDVDESPALVAGLDKGTVDADLRAKFKAAGVGLSGDAIASPVCAGKEWVVLDPGVANTVARPYRGRYPVVAGTGVRGGKTVKVLDVFPGPLAASPAVAGGATKALFPDDPSNVYHSNIRDHVKFRILHAGAGPSHVHHLHAPILSGILGKIPS